jgi:hypothetical protein
MNLRAPALLLLAAALPALPACSDLTGTRGARVPGIVEWEVTPGFAELPGLSEVPPYMLPRIVAPDTVQAGVHFDATVSTVGADGCWRAEGATVELAPMLAAVRPYDRANHSGGTVCPQMVVNLPRTVRLVFAEPGEGVIRVHGRRVVDGNLAAATEATVERRVVVR